MNDYKQELMQRSNNERNNNNNNFNTNTQSQKPVTAHQPTEIRRTKNPVLAHFFIWGGYVLLILVLLGFTLINTFIKPNFVQLSLNPITEVHASSNAIIAQGLISPSDNPGAIANQNGKNYNPTDSSNEEKEESFDYDKNEESFGYEQNHVKTVANFGLGLLGFIATVLMIIGPMIGFYLMGNKVVEPHMTLDPRSGKGNQSEVPEEVKGWNFGAFTLPLFFGLYYRLPIGLLALVPFVNIIIMFYLGMYGNQLAWKKQPWLSVYEFNTFKARWNTAGLIIFLFTIGVPLVIIMLSIIF